ncbi:MAG: flagellar biosynthesis repressor FlbT [Rhizobiaceae bacterium]|nr:flagellar biosynthesis repressor FlbT [Rhizobiaceae bacterium]
MSTLKVTLRAGEKIFVNGAVMRVDRKTSIELLNDVTFLLESHVMQAADATTPLRQLYFLVQMMLIDPAEADTAREAFNRTYPLLMAAFSNMTIRDGLMDIADLVERERSFDALKCLRGLIPIEDAIIRGVRLPSTSTYSEARVPAAMGARS